MSFEPHELSYPILTVATDPDIPARESADLAIAAMHGGANVITVRRPYADPEEVASITRRILRARPASSPCLVVIHQRWDLVKELGADGCWLPERDVEVQPPAMPIVLRSVHSLDQALAAEQAGANALVYGHVYETVSHPLVPGAGLEALKVVVDGVSLPVIAIGGIGPSQASDVMATGAKGIAVIRAVSRTAHPELETRNLVSILRKAMP